VVARRELRERYVEQRGQDAGAGRTAAPLALDPPDLGVRNTLQLTVDFGALARERLLRVPPLQPPISD